MLYAALKEMAIKLGPDARLPTVDTLCSQLDVAKVTLDCALRRLESEQVLALLGAERNEARVLKRMIERKINSPITSRRFPA